MRATWMLLALLLLGGSARAKESVGDLVERLESPNPTIRVDAIDDLSGHRGDKVLVALLVALRDPAAEVRAHAAEALSVVGDPRAVPFLHRALTDVDPTVRCRSILALGSLADRYIIPSVTRALGDPVGFVRAAAIRALGELGDPLSLPVILDALRRETDDLNGSVTATTLIASAKLGGPRGIERVLRIAKDRIDAHWFLRATLARAIGIALDESRIARLETLLASDPDPRVSQAAASSLALLGRVEPLEAATGSIDEFRRRAAVAALAQIPGQAVEAILVRMVNDAKPSVVLEAADSLAARGNVDALSVLIGLLEVDHPAWMGALASLRRRTGADIDRNPPRWRDWFDRYRGRLVFDRDAGMFRVPE